jgi:membrane protein implicated in regulation of membrane protease activity
MDVFGFLDGVSPWWWVAGAIVLAGMEMLTVSTVLIWSALAAMVTALVLWLAPGLPGTWQVAMFALLSIAFTFAGRAVVRRYGDGPDEASRLNRRAAHLVGREAVVVGFEHHEGQVTIDGVPWPARLDGRDRKLAPGDRVTVVAADGIVVWIRPD